MDILVVLTGRSGHGKDAVADIGVEKFGCSGKVALADWSKQVLSDVFGVPLDSFYGESKDVEFDKPLIVTMRAMRLLKREFTDAAGIGSMVDSIPISKFIGRALKTPREALWFFAEELVSLNKGHDFHCKVLEKLALPKIRRKDGLNLIFVTDARNYNQSKYFVDSGSYKYVYPVRVVRKLIKSKDDEEVTQEIPIIEHDTEEQTEAFPKNYFFATLENKGSKSSLESSVKKLLSEIDKDLKIKNAHINAQRSV